MVREKENKNVSPFGFRDKLGYMFGDFGNDFTFILSSSFLMKFYTDVMGIDGLVVGIAMMTARVVDGFTDIFMGRLCDRRKGTAAGKFKPWLLFMCVPVAVSSFLIYQSGFSGMSTGFKTVWLFVTYILWGSFFYTAVNIPYGSMASAISPEPEDRQSLSTYRTIGGALAGMVIGAGVPAVAYDTIDGNKVLNGGRFTVIAGMFSILAILCYLLCYFLITERVRTKDDAGREKNSIGTMLKNAFTNRALLSIIVISIAMLLAQLTQQSMANYIYPNFYGNTDAQAIATLIMMAGMFVAAALAKPCAKKWGKRELSFWACVLAILSSLICYVLRPENVWVFVGFQTVIYFAQGLFTMVSWAMITDVIDYSEIRNGVREDGSVYALYSFARKLGQAASSGVSGGLITLIGYSTATAFDPPVLDGIFRITLLVPAAGFLIAALVLWFGYPLNKRSVEENVEFLKKKHEES